MKGYKIAVGIDKVKGPFEVMVELEIPETSIVIVPDCNSRSKKRRTDKAIVEKIYSIDEVVIVENWNGKAYSLMNLSTSLFGRSEWDFHKDRLTIDTVEDIFVYENGKEVRSRLCEDPFTDCAEGIHFYKTKEDALDLIKSTCSWAAPAFRILKEGYKHSDDLKRWYRILIDNT